MSTLSLGAPHILTIKNIPTTDSLDIANFFDKTHPEILEVISKLNLPEEVKSLNFEEMIFLIDIDRKYQIFRITYYGFTLIVRNLQSLSTHLVKAYIAAFESEHEKIELSHPESFFYSDEKIIA